MNNTCQICLTEIKQMCRKNTGICGEICEKAKKKIANQSHVYGWGVAYLLEMDEKLKKGDIKINPDHTLDMWTGSEWVLLQQEPTIVEHNGYQIPAESPSLITVNAGPGPGSTYERKASVYG